LLYGLAYPIEDTPEPAEISGASDSEDNASELTPANRLRDLEQLKQGGLISQEEYEAKRRELVAKL
jgi:hypothetical protein